MAVFLSCVWNLILIRKTNEYESQHFKNDKSIYQFIRTEGYYRLMRLLVWHRIGLIGWVNWNKSKGIICVDSFISEPWSWFENEQDTLYGHLESPVYTAHTITITYCKWALKKVTEVAIFSRMLCWATDHHKIQKYFDCEPISGHY